MACHASPRTWPGLRAGGRWRRARPRCQARADWSTGLKPPLQSAAFCTLDPNPDGRCAHGLSEGPHVPPTSRGEGQGAKEETSQAGRAGRLAQHRGAHRLKKALAVWAPSLRLHLCSWEHGETEGRESAPDPGLTPPSNRQTAALSTAVQLLPEFISYF